MTALGITSGTEPSDVPSVAARMVEQQKPDLLLTQEHHMCPGCGEPVAIRQFLETITQLDAVERAIGVAGIGCYTSFSGTMDVDLVQALHGRAPSVATGVKRMLPDALVFTLQGDGDMVNEGLQEVIHTAARGETSSGLRSMTGGGLTSTIPTRRRTMGDVGDSISTQRSTHGARTASSSGNISDIESCHLG